VTESQLAPRILVLASSAQKPDDEKIRRLVAEDIVPDALLAEDALGASSLDERGLAAVAGLRGRLLRRLPVSVALSVEAWLRRDEFDVVLSWGERTAFSMALLLAFTRTRRVGHIAILMWPFESSSSSAIKRLLKRTALPVLARRGIDRLCVPAPYQRELVTQRWRIPRSRMMKANWSVDTQFWGPMERTESNLICSVGREMRDYETLVSALRTLEIPCHIAAGTGVLNEAFSSFDSRASNVAAKSLPPGVTAGPKSPSELRELYANARLVVVPVMPSESDNGVTSILEAMAMGRAVVSTATVGRAQILEHDVNCLLVAPRDRIALSAAIQELWDDPERRARLGAAGRERVLAEHSIDQWLSAIRTAASEIVSSMGR
jgi:glycosyltransferase involved in cell wall biosynthesis